jgi:hypothetical protein
MPDETGPLVLPADEFAAVQKLQGRLVELENAVNWGTSCLSCAGLLDSLTSAEAKLAALSEPGAQIVTRARLADALSRITLKPARFEEGKPGVVVAEWMADALMEVLEGTAPAPVPAPEPDPPMEPLSPLPVEGAS